MAGERGCSECGARRPELLTCAGCGEAAYCAAACQRKAWKVHRAACRPFRVEAVAGKGLGMVAARPLRAGARVLLEAPVLVRSLARAEAAAAPGLAEQLAALPEELQRRVLALHTEDPAASQEERLRGVFEANAIEVASAKCTALYPTIPRINHSCAPTAAWSWVPGRPLAKEVRAVRDIPAGGEVTANYIDGWEATFSPCAERQTRLRHWNFECGCEVCGAEPEERERDDGVRRRIALQHQLIPRYMAEWKVGQAAAAARAKLELMLTIPGLETTIPSALLEVWEMARLGRELGVPGAEDCAALLQEAERRADTLGGRFMAAHREKVEQVEATVAAVAERRRREGAALFNQL